MCQSAARGELCGLCFYIAYRLNSAPEDGSGPRPVQLVQRGPLPSAGERALDQECSATYLFVPVYHLFTEGFDTLDLKDAKALLEELAQREGGRKFVSLLRARTVAFAACSGTVAPGATLPPTGASSWTPGLPEATTVDPNFVQLRPGRPRVGERSQARCPR